MSRTVEIPPSQWLRYLDALSKRATNYPIRVEVENRQLGDQQLARVSPLVGITLEKKGSEAGDIALVVAAGTDSFEHRIDDPRRIYVLEDDVGNIECIEVEDKAKGKTFIYFERLPGLPADTGELEGARAEEGVAAEAGPPAT